MTSIVLWIFSTLTVIGVIALVVGLIMMLSKGFKKQVAFIQENALSFAFIVALVATLGSLIFSEVLGFTPCKLCWFQRICMYPQVVILGIAVWKTDFKARLSAAVLSVIGLLIALYHVLVQTFPAWFQCSDETANCSFVQFKYFGFITIPVMAATAFALILLLIFFSQKKAK